ncbi:MAG: S8 family peptidase [Micromonosporaceae bacterium]
MTSPSKRFLLCATAALGLAVATVVLPASASASLVPVTPATGDAAPGQYIVTLRSGVAAASAARTMGVSATHTYRSVLNGFAARLSSTQLAALRRSPAVAAIEQDQVVRVSTTQSNPPWGLDRIDQRALPLSNSYTYTATAPNVHAYIIDTGIEASHAEFEGRASQDFNGVDLILGDCHGHGTHVSGTIGAKTYGVAKKARLHGVKVLNCAGAGLNSTVIAGIDWVASNHSKPAVANMSLGGGKSDAVNTATNNLANRGVFVAVAAGNDDADACDSSPASASNATTVMASDKSDNKASFSNFGSCAHLYAPGVSVLSTFLLGGTSTLSGTSMASPHVAGVAALYKGTHSDASYSTIRSWLVGNGTSGVIKGNPAGTANVLLYTNGL